MQIRPANHERRLGLEGELDSIGNRALSNLKPEAITIELSTVFSNCDTAAQACDRALLHAGTLEVAPSAGRR